MWPENETRREVCKSEARVYGAVREGLPTRRVDDVSYEGDACGEGGGRVCKGKGESKSKRTDKTKTKTKTACETRKTQNENKLKRGLAK